MDFTRKVTEGNIVWTDVSALWALVCLHLELCRSNFSRGIERQKEGYHGTNIT